MTHINIARTRPSLRSSLRVLGRWTVYTYWCIERATLLAQRLVEFERDELENSVKGVHAGNYVDDDLNEDAAATRKRKKAVAATHIQKYNDVGFVALGTAGDLIGGINLSRSSSRFSHLPFAPSLTRTPKSFTKLVSVAHVR